MKDFEIINGTLIKYYGADIEVTIPDGVTSIGYGAFYGGNLTSITIPDGVTMIGDWAFAFCNSLTSITIPDGVTMIGDWTFYRCSSLMNITIPKSVKSIGDGAFYNCTNLTSIVIPDSITSIGNCAFYDCCSLTSIIIPNSIKNIGGYAFCGCSNFKLYKNRYFKATDEKMQCNDFQYEIGKIYKTDKAELCKYGFHACRSPLDIFNYYYGQLGKYVRLFEVELGGVTEEHESDSKCVGTEITFLRELTISELAELASKNEE